VGVYGRQTALSAPSSRPALPGAEALDLPPDWAGAIDAILSAGLRRVAVLGPADAGKSSFCQVLLAAAARTGHPAFLLDTDLGQKSVGPPAAVTLADARRPGCLLGMEFVGATDPLRGWKRLIAGIRHALAGAPAGLMVVNTCGLLAGPGQALKRAKLEAIQPELVVVIGADPSLEAILDQHRHLQAVRLARPEQARPKTAAQRRHFRQEAFHRYFADASPHQILAKSVALADPTVLPERLLLGLGNARSDLGMGILLAVQGDPDRLTLLRPSLEGRTTRLVPGLLQLDEHFRDHPACLAGGGRTPDRVEA
jgi:polynucleotide 5'-hydroxyl-kinase GRC3/NOL9